GVLGSGVRPADRVGALCREIGVQASPAAVQDEVAQRADHRPTLKFETPPVSFGTGDPLRSQARSGISTKRTRSFEGSRINAGVSMTRPSAREASGSRSS